MPLYVPSTGGGSSVTDMWRPTVRSGEYLAPMLTPGNFAPTLNRVYAYPQWVPQSFTLQSVDCEIQTGVATAVWRFGAMSDAGGRPGTLLVDWGTVDASVATFKSISTSYSFPSAGGLFWIIGSAQVAAAAIRGSTGMLGLSGIGNDLNLQSQRAGIRPANTASGAFPSDWITDYGDTTAWESTVHRLLLRRA